MSEEAPETTTEFAGEIVWLFVGIVVCIPVGIYYWWANREERQVCPSCRESADMQASKCPNCGSDL